MPHADLELPRPPLQEINRARGRMGLDYSGISSRGSVTSSTKIKKDATGLFTVTASAPARST